MRVLIAPDSYGDSLSAGEAAEAIAVGWSQARPRDEVVRAPQSDGGPGFVDVLAAQLGGRRVLRVNGPLGEHVDAEWVLDGTTAYIESAEACGLHLLEGPPTPETAIAAHTRGVGQLINAAVAAGARHIVVGLGGSATTDGGRGMLDAFGGLVAARRRLAHVELIVATDVDNPLLGPMGAAQVFGPQKGADVATVALLDRRMTDWAKRLDATAAGPVSARPGAAAAGGLGAALMALGGRRESGAAVVAGHTGLGEAVATADLVVTGEGCLDEQSLRGKVVGAIARMAQSEGVPVLVLAGQVMLDEPRRREAGITGVRSIAQHAGSVRLAIDDAATQLAGLARQTAAKAARWAQAREYRQGKVPLIEGP